MLSFAIDYVLPAALTLGCLYWIALAVFFFRSVRRMPSIDDFDVPKAIPLPKVSVVIPALNEAHTIEEAMASKLAQDYPELEFVLVDDRSTDETGVIMDRIANEDSRVSVVHVTELPAGWLGKVNALQKGVEQSTGDWILFSDADVWLAPDAIRKAVGWCESNELDHLPVFCQFIQGTFWLDAVLIQLSAFLGAVAYRKALENPKSKLAVGAGAFNLFRRSALNRTPGLQWIRLDVVDDSALGRMLKEHGARTSIASGFNSVKVQFYSSVPEMARGAEKNTFVLSGRCSPARATAVGLTQLFLSLSPVLALVYYTLPWVQALGAVAVMTMLAVSLGAARWSHARASAAFVAPIGSALFAYMVVRGAWVGYRQGGIQWRGTHYPSKVLREG